MPADTPPDDLVRKVAEAISAHVGSLHADSWIGEARAAVAVMQPELDRVTADLAEARAALDAVRALLNGYAAGEHRCDDPDADCASCVVHETLRALLPVNSQENDRA